MILAVNTLALAQTQTNRTISVTVKDTVFLKTTKIVYSLSLDPISGLWDMFSEEGYLEYEPEESYEEYGEYIETEEVEGKKRKNKKEDKVTEESLELEIIEELEENAYIEPITNRLKNSDVVAILEKENFQFEIINHSNYELGKHDTSVMYKIYLPNEEELKRLYNTFKSYEGVHGEVTKIEYQSVQSILPAAYKDLYEKALFEAQLIAKLTGLVVGKVVSVSEPKSEFDNYFESYEDLIEDMSFAQKDIMDFKGKEEIVERQFIFEVK